MTVLLDTNVLVDALNGRRERLKFIDGLVEAGHVLACCAVTIAEVHAGMRNDERIATEELLDGLEYFDINRSVAKRAGDLKATWSRKGRTLDLPDALVAATALEHGLALATENRKDFPMPELRLVALPAVH